MFVLHAFSLIRVHEVLCSSEPACPLELCHCLSSIFAWSLQSDSAVSHATAEEQGSDTVLRRAAHSPSLSCASLLHFVSLPSGFHPLTWVSSNGVLLEGVTLHWKMRLAEDVQTSASLLDWADALPSAFSGSELTSTWQRPYLAWLHFLLAPAAASGRRPPVSPEDISRQSRGCQCLSQHPQRSSRAGGAAHSAPGVAAHYPYQ